MIKKKLLMLLALVAAVLVCTSALLEAQADDTYNFYFQKAPGPTTVNQGVSPAPPAVSLKTDPLGQATSMQTPTTPSTVAQAASLDEPARGVRSFELSLGLSGSKFTGGGNSDRYGYYDFQQDSPIVNSGHYTIGLQWNATPYFALQAEAFYLTQAPSKTYQGQEIKAEGSRLDSGFSLLITPFRLGTPEGSLKINGSLVAGVMSSPVLQGSSQFGVNANPERLTHAGSFHYGARLGLDFGRVAFNTTIRRLERFSTTHGTAALAFAL